jgi:preprotein translocase SecE subunit
LDTLKQVKKPTKKEVVNITIAIFIIVILAWIFFSVTDFVISNVYSLFYNLKF